MSGLWSIPPEEESRETEPGPPRPARFEAMRGWAHRFRYWLIGFAAVTIGALFAWSHFSLQRQIAHGMEAYGTGNYSLAVRYFRDILESHPDNLDARLQLAKALTGEYISGGDSPENGMIARDAHAELERVLGRNPENGAAVESLAFLYDKEGKFEEARQWYKKAIVGQSDRKQAYCRLGLTVRAEFFAIRLSARAAANMAPEDAGPLPMPERQRLRAAWLAGIGEAIDDLHKALEIDNNYEDAMTGMNLLLRDRADLADDASQYERDLQAAAQWAEKAAEVRRLKAAPGGGK